MQVIVKRIPSNPQVIDVEPTNLPAEFEGMDEHGHPRRYTFVGPDGQPHAFIIPAGTKGLPMDTAVPRDEKNLESLRALLRKYPTPGGMTIRIIDLEQNAEAENKRRQKRRAVEARIGEREADTGFMVSLARRLGHAAVEKISQQETIDFVYARCETNPDAVAAILDDSFQQQLFVISDSLAKGYLSRSEEGIYAYGTRPLGRTEQSVLQFFADAPDVYMELRRLLGRAGINTGVSTAPAAGESVVVTDATSSVAAGGTAPDEALLRRAETAKLVQKGLDKQILTETIDERGNPCLAFGEIMLSNARVGGTPVEQAIESLSLSNNKSLRNRLEARLK